MLAFLFNSMILRKWGICVIAKKIVAVGKKEK
jgi:hypothetical protein